MTATELGVRTSRDAAEKQAVLLLIEDDEVDAQRIDRWLGSMADMDWSVVHATTLHAALEVLHHDAVDFAVVDLTLPDAAGLDVVRLVRKAAPTIPVVVQTGVDDVDTPIAALGLGAEDYLAKDSLTKEGLQRSVRYAATRHALHRTSESLAETHAELDEFAHVVAHDLRAPVRTARLLADRLLAKTDTDDPLVADLGDRLDDALARVDGMILSMLDYSALRHARPSIACVDLCTAVGEAFQAVEGDVVGAGAEFESTIEPGTSAATNADLLQRVLINVLTNSIKYRRRDTPLRISVSAKRSGDAMVVSVSDNGQGIPPPHRERVFELLERLDTAQSGLGFGLAICRRALDRCGGGIWIEAKEPPGTTVQIELPLRLPPE